MLKNVRPAAEPVSPHPSDATPERFREVGVIQPGDVPTLDQPWSPSTSQRKTASTIPEHLRELGIGNRGVQD